MPEGSRAEENQKINDIRKFGQIADVLVEQGRPDLAEFIITVIYHLSDS